MGSDLAYAALLLSKAIRTSSTVTMCTAAFANQPDSGSMGFFLWSCPGHKMRFQCWDISSKPRCLTQNLCLCGPYSSHLSYPPFPSPDSFPSFSPAHPAQLSLLNTHWERLKRRLPFPRTSASFLDGILKSYPILSPERTSKDLAQAAETRLVAASRVPNLWGFAFSLTSASRTCPVQY